MVLTVWSAEFFHVFITKKRLLNWLVRYCFDCDRAEICVLESENGGHIFTVYSGKKCCQCCYLCCAIQGGVITHDCIDGHICT